MKGGIWGGAAQPIDWYHHDSKPYRLVFAGVSRMATVYKHHEVNIVALAACRPGDIAIVAAPTAGGCGLSVPTATSTVMTRRILPIWKPCGRPRRRRNSGSIKGPEKLSAIHWTSAFNLPIILLLSEGKLSGSSKKCLVQYR